jgi:hypothetical protein
MPTDAARLVPTTTELDAGNSPALSLEEWGQIRGVRSFCAKDERHRVGCVRKTAVLRGIHLGTALAPVPERVSRVERGRHEHDESGGLQRDKPDRG